MLGLLKNISYSVMANCVSVLTSVVIVLFLPKIMTMKDYGFWQLFVFYASYVGIMHLGFADGVYVRYGGKSYSSLNKALVKGQLLVLIFFLLVISFFLINISNIIFNFDEDYKYLVGILCIHGVLFNIVGTINYILQITNRITDYVKVVILQKLVELIFIVVFITAGYLEYRILVLSIPISYVIALCYAFYLIYDIFSVDMKEDLSLVIKEYSNNLNVGYKIMFAYIASFLIIGIIRFFVSKEWDIVTFGKLSLSLSLANFIMVFINAVSIVFFPFLKRLNFNTMVKLFIVLRKYLSLFLVTLMFLFFPLSIFLQWWIPKYAESIYFMGIMFPICIFESKVQLLLFTYLKALREEKKLLAINIITLAVSIVFSIVFIKFLHNLRLVALSIVLVFATKSIISDYYICRKLNIEVRKNLISELCIVFSFVYFNYIDYSYSFLIFIFVYILYIFINKFSFTEFISVKNI